MAKKAKLSYKKRKHVFTRDKFTCRYCSLKATRIVDDVGISFKPIFMIYADSQWENFAIDHKKPRSKGGTNALCNLITACGRCNRKKGNKTYKQFLIEITIWQKEE